jgi:hypothetical protein
MENHMGQTQVVLNVILIMTKLKQASTLLCMIPKEDEHMTIYIGSRAGTERCQELLEDSLLRLTRVPMRTTLFKQGHFPL